MFIYLIVFRLLLSLFRALYCLTEKEMLWVMLMAKMVTLTDEVEVDVIQYTAQYRRGLVAIVRSSISNLYSEATQRLLVLFVAATSGRVKGSIPSIMGVFIAACWRNSVRLLTSRARSTGAFQSWPALLLLLGSVIICLKIRVNSI